jgi:hypothetical protein
MSESNANASVLNKFATPALVLGITSAVLYEFFLPSIVAIVLGAMGVGRSTELKKDGVEKTGHGKSVAGLILGLVYLLCGFVAATTDLI